MIDSPAQISVKSAVASTSGKALTTTSNSAVFVQPFASTPDTSYVAVSSGVNGTPSTTSPSQVYTNAPSPSSVTEAPAQIEASPKILTSGNA